MTDDLTRTLRDVVQRLEERRRTIKRRSEGRAEAVVEAEPATMTAIPYMVVGSIAALAHGRARSTQDFDLVVELSLTTLDELLGSLSPERFYVSREAAMDAMRQQSLFNVIDMDTGWKVDLVPRKRREFSKLELSRRRRLRVLDLEVDVASIEDTIVAKLEWAALGGGSQRQLEDVTELARIAGDGLDRVYVERWTKELGLSAEWARALADLDAAL